MRSFGYLALLLSAASASAQLNHYGGGGESSSLDGRWRVWSRAPDADESINTAAWLQGPGVPRRRLMAYERAADVIWMASKRHVVLKTQTAHYSTINLFELNVRQNYRPDRAQREIEALLAKLPPRLINVEDRAIALGGAFRQSPCVLVSEAGLPRGRRTGAFISREAAFELLPGSGHARRVKSCPGAVTS